MVQDKLFILGKNRATFEGLMKRLKAGAGPGSLAAEAGFKEASASARRAGSTVFAYVNPAQVMGALGPFIEEGEPSWRAQLSPYDDIEAMAYTSSLDGPGFRDRIYVKIRKGSPLEARIPQQSAALKTHALAPAETGVFMNTMIAIPETFAEIEKQLESMGVPASVWEMVVGAVEEFLDADLVKDVLPNFGPELAVYAAWPGRTLIPDMALMLQVKDQKKLDELVARIKDRTAQIGAISEFEYRGHKIGFLNARTLDQGAFIQTVPPLKPTWTTVSGYLVICPWPQVARNLIRSVVEKRPNLTDQPDFKQVVSRLKADVPEGSRVLSVSYMDLKSIAGFVLDNLAPLAQTLVPADVPLDVAEMPVTETVTKHLFGGAAINYKIGDGYLTDMYSPTGVVAPVAGIAVGAGMATWMMLQRDVAKMGDFMTARAQMQLQGLTHAVKLFQLQEARLPTESEWPDFLSKGSKNHPDPYFDGQAIDPWGNPIQYKRLDKRKFDIISYGADGRPGGVGPNADIHSRRDQQK
jgi:general secretion pathway protein G